ncbi:A disintegrin and metalloproteinase with thrombospondin motifs 12-like [Cylas formicarius]|uniref:A disintegrin and metalloproteinase with thrombospondin motifs 12-like n=1 Tax=Cylas formicarius TaxID=197179 RepID=UPI002958C151|nr:A disintegrin and metalloproteinase with thrombospondin motifs 12-like [Cylas formicarius]
MLLSFYSCAVWTLSVCFCIGKSDGGDTLDGRYTKSLTGYILSVPHKLTPEGQFSTFRIPHFYEYDRDSFTKRKKRDLSDPNVVHYGINMNDRLHHIELWPNSNFLHPNVVIEDRDPTLAIKDRKVRGLDGKKLCHFTGRVRGQPGSKVALSTCDGLVGYVTVDNRRYYIEPVAEHEPNSEGHHLHVMYQHHPGDQKIRKCGTRGMWEEAMKRRFRDKVQAGGELNVAKRGTASVQRYPELTVVCDKKFLTYHKERDVEAYVMTIMNMVSDYYHDASSGNQIDIAVVRIIYLQKEEEEIDLTINRDAEKTLDSFCNWTQKINLPVESPQHHDIALLLTRYDLCAEGESECGLTGLAYIAGGCTEDQQCAINEDCGLVLAVIVAHEIGHLLGSSHDEEETDCAVQDTDESYYVMSPYVNLFTIRWSPCSKSMMKAFFDNDLGECFNDLPTSTLYPFSKTLPGVVYDATEQCKFNFPGSKLCSGMKDRVCEQLVCAVGKKKCLSKNEPAADGTKCGENKWCFKKKCVAMGERPQAIHGGWGEWGAWTDCTRTCGGGITYSERDCDNPVPQNKGRYCLGERRKIKICNTTPCPDGEPTFREQQCAAYNKKPYEEKYHTWTAHIVPDKPCVLYCINEENVFVKMEPVVKDGTRCKPGTKNMCISGACRTIGCDNELGSDAVQDICGVCNGDGTQCKIVEDTYRDSGGSDYTKVAVIPSGSRNLVIEELASSVNTIAISDSSQKKFYLNGDNREELDGEYRFGKSLGIYSHPEPGKEKLVIHGPLSEDLVFFVCFYEAQNVGYSYKYAEPTVDSSYEPHYHWEVAEFSDCSALCGGGTKRAAYNCVEDKAGKVSGNFCVGVDKPPETVMNCNEEPCKKRWKVGRWGQCRACKDKSGVRMRSVECMEENPKAGGDDILVENSLCEGPKPGTYELCEADVKCKRTTGEELPEKLMGTVWKQINLRHVYKRSENSSDKARPPSANKSNLTESIGKLVIDEIPLDRMQLIEYPLVDSQDSANLSDAAFESMGDTVGQVVDTANKKVIKGSDAAIMLHRLQNSSISEKDRPKICCRPKDKKGRRDSKDDRECHLC